MWSTLGWLPDYFGSHPRSWQASTRRPSPILETFVVGEVRKQASWLAEPVTLGHWRTSDGAEVDLVIEYDDGSVVARETKASQRALLQTSGV